MSNNLIFTDKSHYQSIAVALRAKLKTDATYTPAQMASAIASIKAGSSVDIKVDTTETVPWTRPQAWPDLDAIPIDYANDEEVLYLTFDNTHSLIPQQNCWAAFYGAMGGGNATYTVERGTVTNGVFTATVTLTSDPQTNSGDTYGKYVYDYYGDDPSPYPVYRIRPNGVKHFQRLYFAQIPTATSGLSSIIYALYLGCVERVGNLPYLNSLASQGTNVTATYRWGTNYLQRDATAVGKKSNVTSLYYAWQYCRNLRVLDLSRWDTSNWAVTSMAFTWAYCFMLQGLDVTGWDTHNWKVNTLQSTFNSCAALKTLDLSHWNTSNWAVTTLSGTWANCYSLETLNMAGWNTSNWKVNSLANTWQYCYNLKSLSNIFGWNTSGWAVTTMANTWQYCYCLDELDLSKWDVSKWVVTTLASTWQECQLMTSLNVSGWDTSGWKVTTLLSTWTNCWSLQSLDLSDWDVSGWTVNTLANTWQSCWSLQSLDCSDWDTSGWAVTTLVNTWQNCRSLKSLSTISDWDTSNWAVTTLSYAWAYCYSLKEIDISDWDTSNWVVTTISYAWAYCYSLRAIDISDWDFSGWTGFVTIQYAFRQCRNCRTIKLGSLSLSGCNTSQMGNLFEQCNYLEYIDALNGITGQAIDLGSSHNLTPASLRSLFASIGTNSAAKNFKIHATVYTRLTASDIAVATAKNWNITT